MGSEIKFCLKMNTIFHKDIKQNEKMINTKFRIVVTFGGGMRYKGIR